MKRLTIISLVLFILLSVSSSFAQRGLQNNPRAKFCMAFGLNLTEDQQKEINKLRLEMQKDMIPLRNRVQTLRSEYRLMILDEKISEAKLKVQLDKIAELRKEMELKRANHKRQVRSLLTDEQKVKFDQHILSGRGHGMRGKAGMRGRMGKFHRGNPQNFDDKM